MAKIWENERVEIKGVEIRDFWKKRETKRNDQRKDRVRFKES